MKKNKPNLPTPILVLIGALTLVVGGFYLKNNFAISSNERGQNMKNQITQNSPVKKLSPTQFQELISDDKVFVIDVHTPEQVHIPGTDILIPFDKIPQNLAKLPADKSTPLAVYCRSGGMSAGSAKELVDLGYTNVSELVGGANAYKKEIKEGVVNIEPTQQNLGTVIYGDVATTGFALTNFSAQPLEITRVSTSCGCTTATIEKENLDPYETTYINVSFDPAVHKDETDLGELTRTIYIETNNPTYPKLETTITANVIKK